MFIASQNHIPEMNPTRYIKMTAKDFKNMENPPQGPLPWDEFDDDMEVVHTITCAESGSLQVEFCTPPPYVLDHFTDMPYIYSLGGSFDKKCVEQLHNYLIENVPDGSPIELWSLWIGDEGEKINRKRLNVKELSSMELEKIKKPNWCMVIDK